MNLAWALGLTMLRLNWKGVACLVLAFAPVSLSAASAAGAPKKQKKHFNKAPVAATSSWQPEFAESHAPAIWTGIYAGLSAGYGWGTSEQTYIRNDNHGLASTSPNGPLAALTLGYNHMLDGSILVGVEGDHGLAEPQISTSTNPKSRRGAPPLMGGLGPDIPLTRLQTFF